MSRKLKGTGSKKIGAAILCSACIFSLAVIPGNDVAASSRRRTQSWNQSSNQSYIGEARALEIALSYVGLSATDVSVKKNRFEWDDGRPEYEIEFYSGDYEYDFTIDAVSGRVREFERERYRSSNAVRPAAPAPAPAAPAPAAPAPAPATDIGRNAALSIALAHAGLREADVTRIKIELDRGRNGSKYEVEFRQGRVEYEYDIDATTGRILDVDIDYD